MRNTMIGVFWDAYKWFLLPVIVMVGILPFSFLFSDSLAFWLRLLLMYGGSGLVGALLFIVMRGDMWEMVSMRLGSLTTLTTAATAAVLLLEIEVMVLLVPYTLLLMYLWYAHRQQWIHEWRRTATCMLATSVILASPAAYVAWWM